MKKTACCFCALICLLGLCSCEKKPSQEDALAIANACYEKAYELNVIFYGEGLAHEEDTEKDYVSVLSSAPYTEESTLADATKEVFSEDYAEQVLQTAFYGVSGALSGSALLPRYVSDAEGKLTFYQKDGKIDVCHYDRSKTTVKNIKKASFTAVFSDGTTTMEVPFVKEDSVWKIDGPSY